MSTNPVSAALRSGLFTRTVGKRILYFQELSSTMDEAARQAEDGADSAGLGYQQRAICTYR